jgi:hypothetical protein
VKIRQIRAYTSTLFCEKNCQNLKYINKYIIFCHNIPFSKKTTKFQGIFFEKYSWHLDHFSLILFRNVLKTNHHLMLTNDTRLEN